jgi:formamidopyrimidine-DNA glycosylase
VPELPDITVYVEALDPRIVGQRLERVRITAPFLLRTVDPPVSVTEGRLVTSVRRVGKRIAIGVEDDLFLVIHLMIAGRLRWLPRGARVPQRLGLAAFDFSTGTVALTEAGTKKRASLHVVRGEAGLAALDAGGIQPLDVDLAAFRAALTRERHTLKRTLTDPRLFSGVGNAYSDEILHRARLSPVRMSDQLDDAEVERLWPATRETLQDWIDRLRRDAGDRFPEHVTAFRPGMAVHGRYREPCPACGAPVQRNRHADNETNYCPRCQTGGVLLADRALSRLLHADWPRSLEELETTRPSARPPTPTRPRKPGKSKR